VLRKLSIIVHKKLVRKTEDLRINSWKMEEEVVCDEQLNVSCDEINMLDDVEESSEIQP